MMLGRSSKRFIRAVILAALLVLLSVATRMAMEP
jgi:hypothetical protein